eukprot:TRINITY_DN14367_c0_g1_i1.p1 TRINITY_DN14367_c0_g1~~TRINITY_DN14367_c0_g1_i1.p1  ORF type:complete len:190 (-),score=30.14 TRINITY_DN14367_c0_g1_i1:619-1188(-)
MSHGIDLVSSEDVLSVATKVVGRHAVAQEYVHQPYLFDGRKFHFRIYLLVTRWAPTGAFLYDEGLLFRSRHVYDPRKLSEKRDLFSGTSADTEVLRHADFWRSLSAGVAQRVRGRIAKLLSEVLGTSLQESFGAFAPFTEKARGYSCFDLYGADVILNDELDPLLLEINIGRQIFGSCQTSTQEMWRKI